MLLAFGFPNNLEPACREGPQIGRTPRANPNEPRAVGRRRWRLKGFAKAALPFLQRAARPNARAPTIGHVRSGDLCKLKREHRPVRMSNDSDQVRVYPQAHRGAATTVIFVNGGRFRLFHVLAVGGYAPRKRQHAEQKPSSDEPAEKCEVPVTKPDCCFHSKHIKLNLSDGFKCGVFTLGNYSS